MDRFLLVASADVVPARIASLGALVELGVPSEAWHAMSQVGQQLLVDHAAELNPMQFDRLVRAAALIPDPGVRTHLYRLSDVIAPRSHRALVDALGWAHDSVALDVLIPAAARNPDPIAAYIVATFPAHLLVDRIDELRAAAARAVDLDTRLWLAVAMAKQLDAGPLVNVLEQITNVGVPRALYGPTWSVAGRFRRVGGLPHSIATRFSEVAEDEERPRATRFLASMLAGGYASKRASSAVARQQAERVSERIVMLDPLDMRAAATVRPMVDALADLQPIHAPRVLKAAVDLAMSPHASVRALGREVTNAAVTPALAQDVEGLHPVVEAFDTYRSAVERQIAGFVRPPAALALGIGPSDELADAALDRVARLDDSEMRVAMLDITRDAAVALGMRGREGSRVDIGDPGDPGGGAPLGPIGVVLASPAEPQREVYPRLRPTGERPVRVPNGQVVLEVGIQERPDTALEESFKASIPARGVHELVVHLFSDVFRLADPLRTQLRLVVTAVTPFPYEKVTLLAPTLAELGDDAPEVGTVRATYYLDEVPLGIATVRIPLAIGVATASSHEAQPTVTFTVSDTGPDLTITVATRQGQYVWAVGPWSRLPNGLTLDPLDAKGSGAIAAEIRELLDGLAKGSVTQANVSGQLPGKFQRLSDAIPDEVWSQIRDAADRAQGQSRVPAVVLITDDPNVPWEAAAIGKELIEPPPGVVQARVLGAQVTVGRIDGRTDRGLASPLERPTTSVRFLAPRYEKTRLGELRSARDEVASLKLELGMEDVDSLPDELDEFLAFLGAGDYPDVLHVAAHGRLNEDRDDAGLPLLGVTLDREEYEVVSLVPDHISWRNFGQKTFVFLNLCFAAAGTTVLGQAVTLANAFAVANARGVVAPLWQVDDRRAAEYATALYRMARTHTLAEAVRQLRSGFVEDDDLTWLAYRFFGHPDARLTLPTARSTEAPA